MKLRTPLIALIALGAILAPLSAAQGMPPEARENIHTLFNRHAEISRSVTMTDDGYVAITESDDPAVAEALRGHVQQMNERLASGRMVRGWDPAFAEYVEHYSDIEHQIEPTEMGLKVTVTGTTPAAIKVAQNHADVIVNFVARGWAEHDESHPRVVEGYGEPEQRARGCCASKGGKKRGCGYRAGSK